MGTTGIGVGVTFWAALTSARAAISWTTASKWPFLDAMKRGLGPVCDARRHVEQGRGPRRLRDQTKERASGCSGAAVRE